MDQPSYYDVLGLTRTATVEQVRASWKKLVQENHPDHALPSEREAATERTAAINEAYQALSDPESRARYDRRGAGIDRQEGFSTAQTQEVALDALVRLRRERRLGIARGAGAAVIGLAAFAYTLRWLHLW